MSSDFRIRRRLGSRDGVGRVAGRSLPDQWLSVPTDNSANAGMEVASLVRGMVAGADSIDDLGRLRDSGDGQAVQ